MAQIMYVHMSKWINGKKSEGYFFQLWLCQIHALLQPQCGKIWCPIIISFNQVYFNYIDLSQQLLHWWVSPYPSGEENLSHFWLCFPLQENDL
jgi:hypothetical protein